MPDLGQRLADEMSGCKLEVTSFSSRKKMTDSQLARVASFFESDAKSVSGGREILNKKIPEVKTVYGIIRAARAHWQAYTVKYEDGVRLIKVDQIERMNEQINRYQNELAEAKQALYDAWDSVKQDAQRRLAQLYVEADYRIDVRQMIWLTISYPSVQPDKKLEQLGKGILEREIEKCRVKFEQAANVAEQALQQEFADMVNSVAERLEQGESEDGKKRILQQRAVDNIVEFAQRFRALSVSDDAELDALVRQAEQLAVGLDTKAIKKDAGQRATMQQAFANLKASVSKHIVKAAEREIEFE
jgi:hypothetical protein